VHSSDYRCLNTNIFKFSPELSPGLAFVGCQPFDRQRRYNRWGSLALSVLGEQLVHLLHKDLLRGPET
jgi:hypothetical protein